MAKWLGLVATLLATGCATGPAIAVRGAAPAYDVLIRGGTIYNGSGGPAYVGDVGIRGDHIVYAGPPLPL
jgi:N-acyl-D-amino-acid deacylase